MLKLHFMIIAFCVASFVYGIPDVEKRGTGGRPVVDEVLDTALETVRTANEGVAGVLPLDIVGLILLQLFQEIICIAPPVKREIESPLSLSNIGLCDVPHLVSVIFDPDKSPDKCGYISNCLNILSEVATTLSIL